MSHHRGDARIRVDDHGIGLPVGLSAILDVRIGDHRVWSLDPARDGVATPEGVVVAWPPALRAHLDGSADVQVSEHLSGAVHFEERVPFGSGCGTVRVEDASGVPLALDKGGRLAPTFGAGNGDPGLLVGATADLVARLSRLLDGPAFLAFGGLLGAVRTGHLVEHDNDLDVAYLSTHAHPVDVMLESLRLERAIRAEGLHTARMSGNDFKVMLPLPDGSVPAVDVFGGWYVGDDFYLMPSVGAKVSREDLVPPGQVVLEGREIAAPARPEVLLAAIYGPDWRRPDPAFKFHPPRSVRQRLHGWFRGERDHQRYWRDHHTGVDPEGPATGTAGPSGWARAVAGRLPPGARLVELGCGRGSDAVFLAAHGFDVLAHDFDRDQLGRARRTTAAQGTGPRFEPLNLNELRVVLARAALQRHRGRTDAVYARRLLGALKEDGRQNLWRYSQMVLRGGGRLYLEFVTSGDGPDRPLRPGVHRRSIRAEQVVREIQERDGIVEDVEVLAGSMQTCRLTARWR